MDTREDERLYIVLEEDFDITNPYREKVYGYYLDPQIAKNEVLWLRQMGFNARVLIKVIDTRRL